MVGTYIHERSDVLSGLSNCNALEKLAYLIEKHYRSSLGVFLYRKSSDSCHSHKEIFIKHLSVDHSLTGFFQDIKTYHQIRNEI